MQLKKSVRLSTGGVMLALASAVAAQTTGAEAAPGVATGTVTADDSTASTTQFGDIIVTARKRAERLQDVPIAVSAFSADDITARRIATIEDLKGITPNLVINPNTLSANGANIFIRGIGVGDFDRTFNPAVQVVIDGVTFGSSISGQLVNVVDVERIEVLRGPQGTLFGANAIGGVINITRPKPKQEFGGNAELTLGDFGRFDVKGAVTGPLIEGVLAARLSVARLEDDGQFFNRFENRQRGFQDFWTFSPSLRFTPNENVDIVVSYDYFRNRSDFGLLHNRSNQNDLLCLAILLSSTPFCDDPNRDLEVFDQDTPTRLDIKGHAASARAEFDMGDLRLTSITGWSKTNERKQLDFDGVPIPVFASIQPVNERTLSQELRLAYEPNERLNLLVGVYGSRVKYSDGANSLFVFSLLGFPPNTIEVVDKRQTTKSYGGFLSGNYALAEGLRVSLGGRLTHEKKDFIYRNGFNQSGGGFFPDAPGFNNVAAGKESWTQFSPRVGVEYTPVTDVLIYASYAQGFKSGGFNGRGNSNDTIGPYDPEKVGSYEVGFKSEFLDKRLRFNAAAFYADYKDKQEETVRTNPASGATITLVDNASSVRNYGLEIEAAAIPFEGLTISGTAAYLNAKYRSFVTGGFDVADFVKVRNAPKYQYSITGQYEKDLGGASVSGLIAYRWTDDYETHLGPRFDGGGPAPLINDRRGTVNSFGLLDASASVVFDLRETKLRLTVFGKNLTDEVFYNAFYPVANLWNMSSVNPGRTWGVQAGFSF